MFEGSDDVQAIGAEGTVIAIVQHDDVAQPAVRMRDGREPLNQLLRRLRFPVLANF